MKKLTLIISIFCFSLLAYSQKAISVQKSGKGHPIIFLPGFTSPGSVWDEIITKLDGDYEIHKVSYAGFNGLAPIGTPWYRPVSDQLIQYVKKERLTNLTIIGHSMGGNLAIDLAKELGDQVAKMVLVESIPCMRDLMMTGVPAASLQYDSPYNNQMLNMPSEAFAHMALGMSQNMTNDSSKINLLVDWAVEADRKTYVYGYTDLLKLDLRPILTNIEIETLIIGGTFPEKEMVRQNYEKQYANLKNKKIVLLDDSKHFVMFDRPDRLSLEINNYLLSNVQ
ncbi:MAG: alpha/beta hydrolase [Cyclobacteriaceae bacterium]